jgi:hypothetical protein
MDRQKAIERYRQNNLKEVLLEVMTIMEPGETLTWGAKKYEDLLAYAVTYLAAEYQLITGYPVVSLLTDKRDVDDPTPQISDVVQTPADALPLG